MKHYWIYGECICLVASKLIQTHIDINIHVYMQKSRYKYIEIDGKSTDNGSSTEKISQINKIYSNR